jgi:hypothetical protein
MKTDFLPVQTIFWVGQRVKSQSSPRGMFGSRSVNGVRFCDSTGFLVFLMKISQKHATVQYANVFFQYVYA